MGNANGHVSDRRKSLSGGAPSAQVSIISNEFNPHSAHNANVGSPVIQPLGAVRIFFMVWRTMYCNFYAYLHFSTIPKCFVILQIGPVDITKGTNGGNSKSPSKILATGSAFSKTVLGFRPRATTADSGSYNRPRPRATTVSHGSSDGSNSRGSNHYICFLERKVMLSFLKPYYHLQLYHFCILQLNMQDLGNMHQWMGIMLARPICLHRNIRSNHIRWMLQRLLLLHLAKKKRGLPKSYRLFSSTMGMEKKFSYVVRVGLLSKKSTQWDIESKTC